MSGVQNVLGDYITSMPREKQEKRQQIATFTRRYVEAFNMRADQIVIEDIAHHLSIEPRYTGATPVPYSVGQHSIWVSRQFQDRDMRLAGLLHDGAEYVLKDFASPSKKHPAMALYNIEVHKLQRLIYATFGLNPDWVPDRPFAELTGPARELKAADDAAFQIEAKSFWDPVNVPPKDRIRPLPAVEVERLFMREYRAIAGAHLIHDLGRSILDIQRPTQHTRADEPEIVT